MGKYNATFVASMLLGYCFSYTESLLEIVYYFADILGFMLLFFIDYFLNYERYL